MITGCNGLISGQFGTHHLRTIDVEDATVNGVGDADYVFLKNATLADLKIIGKAVDAADSHYLLWPIFTPAQSKKYSKGEKVSTNLIGWTETDDENCLQSDSCFTEFKHKVIGIVSKPSNKKNPINAWSQHRIELDKNVVYMQIGKKPTPWYINLAMSLLGLLLIIVPEYIRHQNHAKSQQK